MNILNIKSMIPILLLFMSLFCCNAPADEDEGPRSITLVEGFHFGYDLEEPDRTFEMPKKLEEISGLGITEDGETLLAVQDEDGILFFINRLVKGCTWNGQGFNRW